MSKQWLTFWLLSLCVTASFADDKPKKDKDGSQPFRKIEVPKPKIEFSKPKAEPPKPKAEAPKPKVELPKPKVETPKPKIEIPKQIKEIPQGKIGQSKPAQPIQPVQDVSKPKIELNKNKLKNEIFNGPNGLGSGFSPNPNINRQPTIRNRENNDNRNRNFDNDRNERSREVHRHEHDSHDDHNHIHNDPNYQRRVRTSGLLQLFLTPNVGSNRPYGYGGYRNDWSDHDHHHHYHVQPQTVIIPVQPQIQPGSSVPPPPRLIVPTADQFGGLAPEHQREILLQAINSLDDDLTRVGTGTQWKKHLQLDGLQESLAEIEGPLDAPDREKFRKHADVFEDVAKQPAYRAISELWGFGTLRVGLREFSLEPIVRIRRAIAMNSGWLSESLSGVGTGAQWKLHLRLEMLMARDPQPPTLDEELARMETVLVKFAKVKANPDFETIAAMPGFAPTHAALSDYVQELRLAAAPPPAQVDVPVLEPAKELPPPPEKKSAE